MTPEERKKLSLIISMAEELLTESPPVPEVPEPLITQPPSPTPDGGIPPGWQDYLKRNPGVKAVPQFNSEQGAWRHYTKWGKRDGRVWGETETASSESVTNQRKFHHYNSAAWHGSGSAVVLCPGDSATEVTMAGRPFVKHGSLDKGREVWTDWRTPGLTGTLNIVIDGKLYRSQITDSSGMTNGDCG